MKTKVDAYTFSASARTVTFTGYATIRLDSVLLVADATAGTLLCSFADPALTGTVAGNVLTLAADTTSLADSDALLVYYDDPAPDAAALAAAQGSGTDADGVALLAEIRDRLDVLIGLMEGNG